MRRKEIKDQVRSRVAWAAFVAVSPPLCCAQVWLLLSQGALARLLRGARHVSGHTELGSSLLQERSVPMSITVYFLGVTQALSSVNLFGIFISSLGML